MNVRPRIPPCLRRSALRKVVLAGLAGLALAGCNAQPIGSFRAPDFVREGGTAQQDLFFRPGSTELARGEAERLNRFLRNLVLTPRDDIVFTIGTSGSDVLDRQRVEQIRASLRPTPARVVIVEPTGFSRPQARADIVLVEVRRYDRVLVDCDNGILTDEELQSSTPIPTFGCATAANRAEMADEARDLLAPRDFGGTPTAPSVRAVEADRQGRVQVRSLSTVTTN